MKIENSVADAMLDIWKEVGSETSLKISGYSMYPLIAQGENVIVKHTDADIRAGDIVAFKRGRRIVVHRVMRVHEVRGESVLLCRGDNNLFLDARVVTSNILGKILSVEKADGRRLDLENWRWQFVEKVIVFLFDQSRKLPRRFFLKRAAKIITTIALALEK
jgi:hypothetical protein